METRVLPQIVPRLLPAMVFLAGCTVGPEYVPPSAPVAAEWSLPTPPEYLHQPVAEGSWWESFGDPVLRDLVRRVRAQNLTLQEASARIAEARARQGIARGGLWPVVAQTDAFSARQFSENGTPLGPIGLGVQPFELWSTGFDAAWEIDVAGKLQRTVEAAGADADASIEHHHDVLVRLVGEVARNYIELRTAQERLAVAHENAGLQRQTLHLTVARHREGAVSRLDVSQAEAQLLETEAAIPELEDAAKRAENRLCVLQGEPPRSLLGELQGPRPVPQPPPAIGLGLPMDLLRRRPDVRQAEREVAAQSAQIGVAAADLYPQLSLTGTFALDANDLASALRTDSLAYAAGPAVRWNILNFGRVRSNIAAQQARFEQAIAQYRQRVLLASEEVENALSALVRQRQREERLARAALAAREAVRVAELQYLEGATGFQSLLDSQRVLVSVQDQHVQARGRVAVAAVALYKALGGGWEVPPPDAASRYPLTTALEAPAETLPAPIPASPPPG